MTAISAIAKGGFRRGSLSVLVGASVLAGLLLDARSANVVAQELTPGNSHEPEYFQVPKDKHHAAMQLARCLKCFRSGIQKIDPPPSVNVEIYKSRSEIKALSVQVLVIFWRKALSNGDN